MPDSGKTREQLLEQIARLESRLSALEREREVSIAESERLAHAEAMLKAVTDNLPDYIYIKDTDSRFILTNRAHLEALGASSLEEVAGKTDFDFFPAELARNYYDDEQKSMRKDLPLLDRIEEVVDHAGTRKWFLTVKVPLHNADKRVIGLVGISRDITDLRRTEQALRESEERLNLALQASGVGTWQYDIDTGRIVWDTRMHALFGIEEDAFPGDFDAVLAMLHPGDRDRFAREIRQALQGHNTFETEYRAVWPEGEVHIHAIRGRVYHTHAGIPYRMMGVCWSVTDRKRILLELQESRERLNLALAASGVGTWSWDILEDVIIWDEHLHRLFGLEPDTFEGTYSAFVALLHPDDRERLVLEIERAVEQGAEYDTEYQVMWPSGETRTLGSRGKVYYSEQNRPLRMAGVCWDITEHKKAENELVQERNLLRTLIDNIPEYIYFKDRESRFITTNTTHARGLRVNSPDEVVGRTDFDFFPPDLAEQYYEDEQRVIATANPLLEREEETIDAGGHRRFLLTTKVPFFDASGEVAGLVGLSYDITARKELEQQRVNHAEELARLNEDLLRRNQELDEFTYVASHDLQEPLRKLSMFSDVLREDMRKENPADAEYDLKAIAGAARRMQALVQGLLALSRSGRQEMNWEQVALDECVDEALDALALRVEESGARIERGPLPIVQGDRGLLTQLYQNLIGNALKFRSDAPPVVRIDCEREPACILGVRDNGIGIKEEYADQIFTPFKRLHRRSEFEGTGIGLAICRRIVERHGGRIWVESAPGSGAHFKFTLG